MRQLKRRNNKLKMKVSMVAVIVCFVLIAKMADASEKAENDTDLWFFWGEGCPLCDEADEWLNDLETAYPEIRIQRLEVFHDEDAKELYSQMMQAHNKEARWVPAFLFEDRVWEGYNEQIKTEIFEITAAFYGGTYHLGGSPDSQDTARDMISDTRISSDLDLGFLGTVSSARQPLLVTTFLIAAVDGFNPCSIWVLTVLLAMIVHLRSRLKIAGVSAVFLVVTGIIYGLFIVGVLSGLKIASHLAAIRIVIALAALCYALVNIKDYLNRKKKMTWSISGQSKTWLAKQLRGYSHEQSWTALLLATCVFAAGAAIIELPCTAGFPVVWAGLVREADLSGMLFMIHVFVYLITYLLIEISLVAVTLITRKAIRITPGNGLRLKLVSGTVMALLAISLLVYPDLLRRITGMLILLAAALCLSGLIIVVRRRLIRSDLS